MNHLDTIVRASLVLACAWLCMAPLKRRSAVVRRVVLSVAFGIVLVLPLVPRWYVHHAAYAAVVVGRIVSEPSQAAFGSVVAAAPSRSWAIDGIAIAWAIGALLVAGRFILGMVLARRIALRGQDAIGWERAAAVAEDVTGVRVPVRASLEVDGPALVGVLAPVILVPTASETWTHERKLAVLVHEHAHVRARDLLVQVVVGIVSSLHWFNPLVWLAARRLRLERELAADEAVLDTGVRASAYAADLVAIARTSPFGAMAMGTPPLSKRVVAIVGQRPKPVGAVALLVAAFAVLAVCACTLAAVSAPAPVAKRAIDGDLQKIAKDELDRTVKESGARGGTILVMTPQGEVLADVGDGDRPYITGSTIKGLVLAAAIDEGAVTESDIFDCSRGERAGKIMHDASPLGRASLAEVLAHSSNVGFGQVFDRLGGARLDRTLRRFGFTPPDALAAAPAGDWEGAVMAIGATMPATPREVTRAYAVLANGGDGIVATSTATRVTTLLEGVVAADGGTGAKARIAGVRVAGKTGSSDWTAPDGKSVTYASFVGYVPADHPRYVIFVGVESPTSSEAWGGAIAAPAFSRVATRALAR